MADRTLKDYANEAKSMADAERAKKEFWQPTSGREAHIRILEWPGHVPCWIQTWVHYLETPEGRKVMTCGDERCYTCARLLDLQHSSVKADTDFARQAGRKAKVLMYIIDLDNPSAGPQLFEPKNTQNCNTWTTLLSLFLSEEWGERVYRLNQGIAISLLIAKETRKMRSGQMEMSIQKSLTPGTTAKPIPHKVDAHGVNWIQLTLPNGQKQVFKLPDLADAVSVYDEDYHRQCWGDESAEAGSDVTFDESGSQTDDAPVSMAEEGVFGSSAGDSWGEAPGADEQGAEQGQYDLFGDQPPPTQAPPPLPPQAPRPSAPRPSAPPQASRPAAQKPKPRPTAASRPAARRPAAKRR